MEQERMTDKEWAAQKRWEKSPAAKLYAEAARLRARESALELEVEQLKKDFSHRATCAYCSWKGPLRPPGDKCDQDEREHLAACESNPLRADVAEMREILWLSDPDGDRAKHIHAPEDPHILALCEQIGFGAVMDSAARQWRLRDPDGAHTVGACAATVRAALAHKSEAPEAKPPRCEVCGVNDDLRGMPDIMSPEGHEVGKAICSTCLIGWYDCGITDPKELAEYSRKKRAHRSEEGVGNG